MRDKQLWHKQQSTRKRKTFQEEIIQLVVPKSERKDILRGFHTLGHTGFDKTYMAVSRVYFWYGMYKNMKNYIRTCPDCQTAKGYHQYKVFLKPLVVRPGFGHTLHLDYSGTYPYSGSGDRYICTIVDSYSTYCWLFPKSNQMAETAVKCLLNICSQIGAF